MGTILAEETRARGAVCLLGPCINIQRSTLGGRAFESPSEDPTLAGHFAAAYINGLEGAGVSASLKHFVCNDQENDRNGSDSVVAPRPLREIYLRPFQLALQKSNPSAVMASYNRLNGTHVSESKEMLQAVLRKEWGFDNLIMSDWNGTYSTAEAINAGLNIEFPGPSRWRTKTLFDQTYEVNKITMREIDRNVTHVLKWVQSMVQRNTDLVYGKVKVERTRHECQESDAKLLRKIAGDGIVLLKNDDKVLPLGPGKVAVIGPFAKAQVFTGGGSARLLSAWGCNPYEALDAGKPDGVELSYTLGTSTARWMPMLDGNFTTEDGTKVGFDIYHYPLKPDGTMGESWLVHDVLKRSEVKYQDFGAPGLEDGYFGEIMTVFTSPITGEYDFGLCITGKGWLWVDDELVWSLTDYKTKGRSFYGSGTDEQYVRIKVEEGKVSCMSLRSESQLTIPRNTAFASCTTSARLPRSNTLSPLPSDTAVCALVRSRHMSLRLPCARRRHSLCRRTSPSLWLVLDQSGKPRV
jgi:beta-glucosidase